MSELGAHGNTVVEDSKFQLGTPPAKFDGLELLWSYGDDRITAMVRSPDSLYLYWEITDEAIARTRARLGPAGATGWFNLRVYDTTGRAFDGTNANHTFDVTVQRTDREYFLDLRRPGSSVHVEIGIKTTEGYFQPIARSGRGDFPRKGPSPNHSLEWMTVTSDDAHPAARPYQSKFDASRVPQAPRAEVRTPPPPPPSPHAIVGGAADLQPYAWMHPAFTEVRWEGPWSFEWRTEWKLRWIGTRGETVVPIETARWTVGPFPTHVLEPVRIEVRFLGDGEVVLEESQSGLQVEGPWEVKIHSFGEEPKERREIGAWRVHVSRVEAAKVERWWVAVERARVNPWQRARAVGMGASESRLAVEGGASEMWRLGASGRWTIGASEWFAHGASETSWRGASELMMQGASGWLYGGASASAWSGASGVGWGGASEAIYGGSSTRLTQSGVGGELGGSSEGLFAGASPHVAGSLMMGASEAYVEWLRTMASGGSKDGEVG